MLLKTEGCLSILQLEYRPWPKVHEGDTVSVKFYMRLDKNKETNMAELNNFHARSDVLRYTQVLKQQLGLFCDGYGKVPQGTNSSHPPPTCSSYSTLTQPHSTTQVTSGIFRNELLTDAQMEEVAQLLCTKNPGERPFAVAKACLSLYGRMNLATLARFSLSVCNGSHRMADPKGKQNKTRNRIVQEAGIAITSDPRVQAVVTRLCAVRRRKPGGVVVLLKDVYKRDQLLSKELRLANEDKEKARMAQKHLNKAIKFNMAVEEPLANTVLQLQTQLKSMDNK